MEMAAKINISKDEMNKYKSFWINTYNLAVIKGIIANYPVKSPLAIPGFFDKELYLLAGKKITLGHLENKLLRAQFDDPRFHFVLVCAGIGCPPIISEAYFPATLEKQLNKQTKLAINNNDFIMINAKKKRVKLSEIFKWYKEDFTTNGKSLIDYVNLYKDGDKLLNNYKVSYYPYNWSLNELK